MLAYTTVHSPFAARWRAVAILPVLVALLLPGLCWAFSPDMLPSPAIWWNFMKKVGEKRAYLVLKQDTRGDGVNDYFVYRHEDGSQIVVKYKPTPEGMKLEYVILEEGKDKRNWVYGFNRNGNARGDVLPIDMVVRGWFSLNGEDHWDQMIYSSKADGKPDRFLLDMDKNGVYDCMGADESGSGKLEYLYDLDNKTGEVLNKTVGWVAFKQQQHREALPQLVYSFPAEVNTLGGTQAAVTRASWDYGDGTVVTMDQLAPGEHRYAKAGTYEVSLEVEFKVKGSDDTWKAWQGVALPVEAPPPGPPPLTPDALKLAVPSFYGACGLVSAEELPKIGTIAELWPEVKLPAGAPAGQALRAHAIAPGELDVAAFWWRSDVEATAFLECLGAAPDPKPDLPAMAASTAAGNTPFAMPNKLRAHMSDKGASHTTAWREGGFIITLTTNRTVEEAQRWTRLFYDILHPAPAATTPPAGPTGGGPAMAPRTGPAGG